MLNISIAWWELALIIIAIVLAIAVFYLVRTLKTLMVAINHYNTLVVENKRSIESILDNVNDITKDATKIANKADNIADEVNDTVTTVKSDVVNPLIQSAVTIVKLITTSTKRKSQKV